MSDNILSFDIYKKKKRDSNIFPSPFKNDHYSEDSFRKREDDVKELIFILFSGEGKAGHYMDYLNQIRDIDEAIYRLNRLLAFLDEECQGIEFPMDA